MEGSLCHLILPSKFCCEHIKLSISWKGLVTYQKRQEDVGKQSNKYFYALLVNHVYVYVAGFGLRVAFI